MKERNHITQILIVGGSSGSQATAISEIKENNAWNALAASTGEEAIEKFHQHACDIVLLMDDLEINEDRRVKRVITFQNPAVVILQYSTMHEGLQVAIEKAVVQSTRNKEPGFTILDNAFENAGLQINIQ